MEIPFQINIKFYEIFLLEYAKEETTRIHVRACKTKKM